MPMIALTGNFGMGKTTVLRLFKEGGAHILSSDALVHEILKLPEVIRKISLLLGTDILTKRSGNLSINKRRMAELIFHDNKKRRAAEKILHPLVLRKIRTTASAIFNREPSALVIVEVPLLFEAGFQRYFDRTIVVTCRKASAQQRLLHRGFSMDEIEKRLQAQMPISRKKKLADFVIDNSADITRTRNKVASILKKLSSSL